MMRSVHHKAKELESVFEEVYMLDVYKSLALNHILYDLMMPKIISVTFESCCSSSGH